MVDTSIDNTKEDIVKSLHMMTQTATTTIGKMVTITAEEKWKQGGLNQQIRKEMLRATSQSESYASDSWKKLPHIVKTNLMNFKNWTN